MEQVPQKRPPIVEPLDLGRFEEIRAPKKSSRKEKTKKDSKKSKKSRHDSKPSKEPRESRIVVDTSIVVGDEDDAHVDSIQMQGEPDILADGSDKDGV